MDRRAFSKLAVFDFDMTVADTTSLEPHRHARDWQTCRQLAPGIEFYVGIREALKDIAHSGIGLTVASSSPSTYLDPFLSRLGVPFADVLGFHDAKGPAPPGVFGRARIKAIQLSILKKRHGVPLVFVGDDADDAAGAAAVGASFVHACWGGGCNGVAGAHPTEPRALARHVIEQSGCFMKFDARVAGPYSYGFMWVERKPTAVLDFWHKDPCERCPDNRCVAGHRAIQLFKANNANVVRTLSEAVGLVAQVEFARTRIGVVVPTIPSRDASVTPESPTGQLAITVARSLGVPADLTSFTQTPREGLSRGGFKNRDQRFSIVYNALRCAPGQFGQRVLLVDDVVSSGATLTAYAKRLDEQGGTVVAVAGIMKNASEEPPLNATLLQQIVCA